ncbi:MAG: RNA-binding transcriptional accessory protein [Gemmatimonadales bacterium]|nr:MAG: RNA-binding transcriptional accessory protein [Gemmatimonadales bacterium]
MPSSTSAPDLSTLGRRVARELSLGVPQVEGALTLFRGGATLPFIARYRKEATGGLDEIQLRDVRDRAAYLEELESRRGTILASVEEQGKLTPELAADIRRAETKQELEDLYLPYRPKRRTRGTMAAERGLSPLAELIWEGRADDREVRRAAAGFVEADEEVPDVEAALQGARDILAERIAEDAPLRRRVRELTRGRGRVVSRVTRGKKDDPGAARFRDYFEHEEPLRSIPSHRMLAIRRGEAEGFLKWEIEGPAGELLVEVERAALGIRAARETLREVARDAAERVLASSIASELAAELKEAADAEAIRVFGENLEQLLLQPPAGERPVLGLDPGFRTGVKAAVVSSTGGVLATDTLYLHQPDRFAEQIRALVKRHGPELIAIGNGTASRETESAVRDALQEGKGGGDGASPAAPPAVVLVNEAGASVYSASELARDELPGMDVSLRGAVSIARRLQDPLAELVKIDPRSIGVGQYQHDVHQPSLKTRLDQTVELCVNRVGVEVNTASPPLLAYVAGIGPTLAQGIVAHRESTGKIRSRKELLEVPRLGPKAFEQAAGFIRIRDGLHPLDATAVHPERYPLVERMARELGMSVGELVKDDAAVATLEGRLDHYVSGDVGLPTLKDILEELRRPGRDPREAFEAPAFRDDIREPSDLKPGMRLQGVVTNVVAFGAFVDVGVHQDGLVHISQLADRFVKDPGEVVKVGQRVTVTVLKVELDRNRIALSMKEQAKG